MTGWKFELRAQEVQEKKSTTFDKAQNITTAAKDYRESPGGKAFKKKLQDELSALNESELADGTTLAQAQSAIIQKYRHDLFDGAWASSWWKDISDMSSATWAMWWLINEVHTKDDGTHQEVLTLYADSEDANHDQYESFWFDVTDLSDDGMIQLIEKIMNKMTEDIDLVEKDQFTASQIELGNSQNLLLQLQAEAKKTASDKIEADKKNQSWWGQDQKTSTESPSIWTDPVWYIEYAMNKIDTMLPEFDKFFDKLGSSLATWPWKITKITNQVSALRDDWSSDSNDNKTNPWSKPSANV